MGVLTVYLDKVRLIGGEKGREWDWVELGRVAVGRVELGRVVLELGRRRYLLPFAFSSTSAFVRPTWHSPSFLQVTDITDSEPGFGKSDPYVTFYLEKNKLLFDKGYGKQSSSVKKNNLNPVYGETFAFSSVDAMKNMELYVKILDSDHGLDDFLGKAKVFLEDLGLNETPKEVVVPVQNRKAKIYLKLSFTK